MEALKRIAEKLHGAPSSTLYVCAPASAQANCGHKLNYAYSGLLFGGAKRAKRARTLDAHMCVMMHNLDSERNLDSGDEQIKKPAFATSYRQGGLAVELICHIVTTIRWTTSEIRVGFCDFGKKDAK